jgi:hypothetical protein
MTLPALLTSRQPLMDFLVHAMHRREQVRVVHPKQKDRRRSTVLSLTVGVDALDFALAA